MKQLAMLVPVLAAAVGLVRAQGLDDHGFVPKAPIELVYARPYQVEKEMGFSIGGKIEKVKKGYVLVLKADLKLCEPKNVPDFTLFVDGVLAQRVNSGYVDGHLVVLIPEVDLTKALVWFGSRLVADRVTPAIVAHERAAALARGIKPFAPEKVAAALALGGDTLRAKDMNELWFLQKALILKYAPAEREMAESLRK